MSLTTDSLNKILEGVAALEECLKCHRCNQLITENEAVTLNCPHHVCSKCADEQQKTERQCVTCGIGYWNKDIKRNVCINSIIDRFHTLKTIAAKATTFMEYDESLLKKLDISLVKPEGDVLDDDSEASPSGFDAALQFEAMVREDDERDANIPSPVPLEIPIDDELNPTDTDTLSPDDATDKDDSSHNSSTDDKSPPAPKRKRGANANRNVTSAVDTSQSSAAPRRRSKRKRSPSPEAIKEDPSSVTPELERDSSEDKENKAVRHRSKRRRMNGTDSQSLSMDVKPSVNNNSSIPNDFSLTFNDSSLFSHTPDTETIDKLKKSTQKSISKARDLDKHQSENGELQPNIEESVSPPDEKEESLSTTVESDVEESDSESDSELQPTRIAICGFPKADKKQLMAMGLAAGLDMQRKWKGKPPNAEPADNDTQAIVSQTYPSNNKPMRNSKIWASLLCRLPIINLRWLEVCSEQKQIVNFRPYLCNIRPIKTPKLFGGYKILFHELLDSAKGTLFNILTLGGAEIMIEEDWDDQRPSAKNHRIMICSQAVGRSDARKRAKEYNCRVISEEWISRSIQPDEPYIKEVNTTARDRTKFPITAPLPLSDYDMTEKESLDVLGDSSESEDY